MEAGVMSVWILDGLKKLEQDPSNPNEIANLKNCADVVMGDAKFLGNKNLERCGKMLMSLLEGEKITEQRLGEISDLIHSFKKFAR